MSTLKEEFKELRGKHGKAKEKCRIKITNALREAMDEFARETDCQIVDVSFEIEKHYRGINCDIAVITNVTLKSDIEESF